MVNSLPPFPEKTPNSTAASHSFFTKIRAHKTGVIIISSAFVLLLGMGTYVLLSPASKTPIAPTIQEPTAAPGIDTSPTTSTSPTLTPIPTKNPAISWKSYTNATYGYTIKYPTDWSARDLGALEPKIPSYLVFNPTVASASARYITISISTRTYSEQLALGASSSAITVAGILGTKQFFQDSNGYTSTAVILPRTNNLVILRAKTEYLTIFTLMLATLQITK